MPIYDSGEMRVLEFGTGDIIVCNTNPTEGYGFDGVGFV